MNIKEYKDKKDKGLAEVVKAGGGYALAVKKYDVDDGTELVPEISAVSVDTLNEKKKVLQAEIEDYDLVIADMEALDLVEGALNL